MDIVDALQQAGFNKYEAEAYVALAAHGPLTGYEVGKRSQVPLSRSYEILERLTEKGWALLQPGEPPRYAALPPPAALARLRSEQAERLAELSGAMTALRNPPQPAGYWVIKGRAAILARVRDIITGARDRVELALGTELYQQLDPALRAVRHVVTVIHAPPPGGGAVHFAVCVDARIVCAGSLTPEATCQALVSDEASLIAATRAQFAPLSPAALPDSGADWLAWEKRKQERMRQRRAS
jgi:hypothetical protein